MQVIDPKTQNLDFAFMTLWEIFEEWVYFKE